MIGGRSRFAWPVIGFLAAVSGWVMFSQERHPAWARNPAISRLPRMAISPAHAFVLAAEGQSFFYNPSMGLMKQPFLPGVYKSFGFSWDGRYFLYLKANGKVPAFSLYRYMLETGAEELVSGPAERVYKAVWAPDSNQIAYLTFESGSKFSIIVADPDSAAKEQIVSGWLDPDVLVWSPDADRVLYQSVRPLSEHAFEDGLFEMTLREYDLRSGSSRALNGAVAGTYHSGRLAHADGQGISVPASGSARALRIPLGTNGVTDLRFVSQSMYVTRVNRGIPEVARYRAESEDFVTIAPGSIHEQIQEGLVIREASGAGVDYRYVDGVTGAVSELLAIASTWKLPFGGKAELVQGGSNYGSGTCDGAACLVVAHTGVLGFALDWAQFEGQGGDGSVLASGDGIVAALANNVTCNSVKTQCPDYRSNCNSNNGAGNYVIIAHLDGTFTMHAHLAFNSISVAVGQSVCQGTRIAKLGHTGSASTVQATVCGDHLHFDRKTALALAGNPLGQTGLPTDFLETPCGLQCRSAYDSQNALGGPCFSPTVIDSIPPGVELLVDGVAYAAPYAFHWSETESHTVSAPDTLPLAGVRYGFADWNDGAPRVRTVKGSAAPSKYTARFVRQYLLNTVVTPSDGGRIDAVPSAADGFYNAGSKVDLTAIPNPGYEFLVWAGDLLNVTTPSASLTVPTRAFSAIANFRQILTISPQGVVNAADYSTEFAPGMIFSIFGRNLGQSDIFAPGVPLPTTLGGVGVRVYDGSNAFDAPVYFVSPGQINAQLPFEIAGPTVQVEVRNRLGAFRTGNIAVAAGAPRLFTKTSDGAGEAFLIRSDYTLVSPALPVASGEIVFTYVNALGAVKPPKLSGFPAGDGDKLGPLNQTVAPVSITVGGQDARVSFAGLAPGLVGVYQVNFEVPSGLAAGDQPIFVSINGQRSQAGVIVPYQP